MDMIFILKFGFGMNIIHNVTQCASCSCERNDSSLSSDGDLSLQFDRLVD